MKYIRILSLSLALVLLVGLFAACGKSNSENVSASQPDASVSLPEADSSAPDASQPEEETFAPGMGEDETIPLPLPETKPEVKPEVESKPESKPEPEAKPEVKPEAKPEETPEVPAAPEQKPAGVDLEAFYQTIFTDPENAPALLPMEADALDAFYPGLNAITLNQKVAYMPMMTAVPCEIVMVECANSADVDAVKAIFQARITSQVDNHFNYPMVIEAWETEATVVSNGNFVALLVISGMTNEVVNNFNALF